MTDAEPKSLPKWLRRQAEIVGSVGVLLGALSAGIVFFGGNIPPWYTPAQAQDSERKSAEIQGRTVDTLGRINDKLDRLARRVDQGECDKLRSTLDQANAGLSRNDQLARVLRDNILARMREIQGCGP